MLRSYTNLTRFDTGYRTTDILRLAISLDAAEFPTAAARLAFGERVKTIFGSMPGTHSVSVMSGTLPPWPNAERSVEQVGAPGVSIAVASRNVVDDAFFETLGVPLVFGRGIEPHDGPDDPPVAVVGRTLARRIGAGNEQAAIGASISLVETDEFAMARRTAFQVVGVVEDVLYGGPRNSTDSGLDLYTPLSQSVGNVLSIAVHNSGNAQAMMPQFVKALASAAPTSPIHWVSSMEDEFALQFRDARLYAWLTTVFGATALILVTMGVFGVISNSVAQRRSEIGIRVAVGATTAGVVALVLRRAAVPLVVGVGGGVVCALAAGSVAQRLVFGIAPTDPLTFGAVTALMLGVGICASLGPALHAASIDPATTLRADRS